MSDVPETAAGDGEPTLHELEAVAAMLPGLLRTEHRPVEVRGGNRLPSGILVMPYVEEPREVWTLIEALYDNHIILPQFDWGAWRAEAERYQDPAAVAVAPLLEVRRLLTLHVRADRFSEGHFSAMVRSGHIAAVLRRLGTIATERRAGARR